MKLHKLSVTHPREFGRQQQYVAVYLVLDETAQGAFAKVYAQANYSKGRVVRYLGDITQDVTAEPLDWYTTHTTPKEFAGRSTAMIELETDGAKSAFPIEVENDQVRV